MPGALETDSVFSRFIEVRAAIGKIHRKLLDSLRATRLEPAFGQIKSALDLAPRGRLAATPGGATQAACGNRNGSSRGLPAAFMATGVPAAQKGSVSWPGANGRAGSNKRSRGRALRPRFSRSGAAYCRCRIAARPAVERDKDK